MDNSAESGPEDEDGATETPPRQRQGRRTASGIDPGIFDQFQDSLGVSGNLASGINPAIFDQIRDSLGVSGNLASGINPAIFDQIRDSLGVSGNLASGINRTLAQHFNGAFGIQAAVASALDLPLVERLAPAAVSVAEYASRKTPQVPPQVERDLSQLSQGEGIVLFLILMFLAAAVLHAAGHHELATAQLQRAIYMAALAGAVGTGLGVKRAVERRRD